MMQPGSGVAPPPMPQMSLEQQQQQHQYQQQQHQQWMMMHQQQQPPQQQAFHHQPPQVWAQQPPQAGQIPPQHTQPQMMQMQAQQQQQQQYQAAPTADSSEIKSLWIGDLQYWMDENYITSLFSQSGELCNVKLIRNKQTGQPEGYGFIEFASRAAAERMLQAYNGQTIPNTEQTFRLNWATLGAGERRADDGPDYTIFVGDLAADVTDYLLLETFKPHYLSLKGAKVVTDRMTGRSKGYGFVRFGDEGEQQRAMNEMNGVVCSTRPMRIGAAATKKPVTGQQYPKATYDNSQANGGETDPNNTTIFVGGLDDSISDDHLRQVFGQYGELVHVKIPPGKRCGFVQFADRACAEQALSMLNGTPLGGQSIRLSWGRSPSNKQAQPDQTQWNGGAGAYYGYTQGYEAYGYAPPPQDPNMYYGGGYPGYGNYQQPQQ